MKLLFALTALFLTGCTSLLYYPTDKKYFDPSQVKLQQEDVSFLDADGRKIQAWWFSAKTKDSKGTFVFFHGNAENMTSHFLAMSWLPESGYNYLIFDYPGYGLSEGKPNPKDNVTSGVAAIEWVQKNKDQRPLIIYGQSMGGIIAVRTFLEIKNKIPVKALISDGSFYSFQRIAKHKLSMHWLTWPLQSLSYLVLSDEYATKKRMGEISPTPLLVIHGDQDVVVEPRWSDEMFEMAKEPKQLWRIPEAQHGDVFWVADKKYRKKLLDYLEALK